MKTYILFTELFKTKKLQPTSEKLAEFQKLEIFF